MTPRSRREVEAALDTAPTWEAWQEAAREADALTGADDWRADDQSDLVDAELLRAEIASLRALREANDGVRLADALTRSLYRHLPDFSAPELYSEALTGTKHVVGDYLDEAEACMRALAVFAGVPHAERLARFKRAWAVFGRTALMLSGGATWGFHHLGVVKALHERGLLPDILSGASTGAMVAAGVCTRNNAELTSLFADLDSMRRDGLAWVGARAAASERAVLDPAQLYAVLRHNIGDATFAEAHAHTGRVLNIAVSPVRVRQKPRLLSHLTSPDVLCVSAALASSALPGLFPPVVLESRGPDGTVRPDDPLERWVDGSIYADLPKLRMARLHNVNHFIVSQVNPHIMPFVQWRNRRGVVPAVAGVATAAARSQGAYAADLARRAARPTSGPLRQLADRAYAMVSQDYRGDIDVYPRFRPSMLAKVVRNPSRADLDEFVLEGQRGVWRVLPAIIDQTRIGRVFQELVGVLQAPA